MTSAYYATEEADLNTEIAACKSLAEAVALEVAIRFYLSIERPRALKTGHQSDFEAHERWVTFRLKELRAKWPA